MSHELPLWLAITVAGFLVWGSGLTLIGCIGLVRFADFYDRLYMPTLGASWGSGGILVASMLYSFFHAGRPVLHELLITVFLFVTAPVAFMMLSRAALHRDDTKDWSELPGGLLPRRADSGGKKEEDTVPQRKKGR